MRVLQSPVQPDDLRAVHPNAQPAPALWGARWVQSTGRPTLADRALAAGAPDLTAPVARAACSG